MTQMRQAFAAFVEAMTKSDIGALRQLTSEEFTLTHITGYVQPRDEWLDEITQGKFVYYGIDVHDVGVEEAGERAMLVSRTVTDARVYGSRNAWKLQLVLSYSLEDGMWIADKAVASIWR